MHKKILFIILVASGSLVIASSIKKENFRERLTLIVTSDTDSKVQQQRVVKANKSCRDLCCVSMCVYSIVLCTIVVLGLSPVAYDNKEEFPIHYIPKTNIGRK